MQLDSLRVIHGLKKSAGSPDLEHSAVNPSRVFFLDSCQRRLWVGASDALESDSTLQKSALQNFKGVHAYLFLLRVATGLESEVKGETDIFGQLKEAWKANPVAELESWMQRLFEDAKEIRSRYLQGLGGASYGTLVRKLLPETGPVLILGAGQIARSVAPFLLDRGLVLWNRSPARLFEFHAELAEKSAAQIQVAASEYEAWTLAKSAVICVPISVPISSGEMPIVHLGGYRHQAEWASAPQFKCLVKYLDDVFELQRSQNELRFFQLAEAERACETRAKLRGLGGSLSIAHGWEDLATFNTGARG
jgi:hypothetical protein